jgi:hypothetical protein
MPVEKPKFGEGPSVRVTVRNGPQGRHAELSHSRPGETYDVVVIDPFGRVSAQFPPVQVDGSGSAWLSLQQIPAGQGYRLSVQNRRTKRKVEITC